MKAVLLCRRRRGISNYWGVSPVPRFNVLGVGVSALNLPQASTLVLEAKHGAPRGYICCGTAHGLTEARRDPALRAAFNGAWLTTPDGMPLVWLGRAAGHAAIGRVYGPDLLLAACDAGRAQGTRHYFFGGVPGVATALAEKLRARFPGLEVAGTTTPPFRPLLPGEFKRLQDDIARTRADIVWVGLGTPKQEKFMAAHAAELAAGVLIGVGAAFDFHSGRVRQAPRWVQRSGFEWIFRLATEPRRLGPRYLKTNPLFAAHVIAQKTGCKAYPIE